VQGFSLLYNLQNNSSEKIQYQYPFLSELTPFLNGLTNKEYLPLIEDVTCNDYSKENVVQLEIDPKSKHENRFLVLPKRS